MRNFCELLCRYVEKNPDKEFFVRGVDSLSCQKFWEQVQVYKDYLNAYNVRDKTVLLFVEDSQKLLFAFFAVVFLRGIPVLVNFNDRFACKEILTTQVYDYICYDLATLIPGDILIDESKRVELVGLLQESVNRSCTFEPVREEESMFALYTSGTSGQPKYVVKSYANIYEELRFLKELTKADHNDIFMKIVPSIHIYGLLLGVLLPVFCGGTIVEASKILPSNGIKMAQDYNASFLIASPIHYQTFAKMQDCRGLARLKYAVSSGAPLAENVAKKFCEETSVSILELYGSTETGGIAYKNWGEAESDLHFFPYIERKEMETEGELVIKSPAISENIKTGEWYVTGDYIHLKKNNTFRIIGRQQQLIKYAGKRVSAIQLEEEVKSIPGVNDAAVIRIEEDSLRGETAILFVACDKGITSTQIKKQFMQKSHYPNIFSQIFMQNPLLRNHNNKVDYATLSHIGKSQILATKLKVGVIVPTFNHERFIENVIRDCQLYTDDIIVVSDGCTDSTNEKIKLFHVEKIILPVNKGKGNALKIGFRKAQELGWEYAITIDSDGQHHAHHILDFLKAIEAHPYSIIVGNRNMDSPQIPSSSKFGKDFTNFWLKIETGKNVADGQSGFRAYPITKINSVKTYFGRYEFEVEILAQSLWRKIEVHSIPIGVEYHPTGGRVSHFRPFLDNFRTSILNTILVVIRIFNLLGLVRFKKL